MFDKYIEHMTRDEMVWAAALIADDNMELMSASLAEKHAEADTVPDDTLREFLRDMSHDAEYFDGILELAVMHAEAARA